jgi:hypothetical protein
LGEFYVGPGFVHLEPTALDRKLEAGAILLRPSFQFEQKQRVDRLDEDSTILYGFDAVGDIDQLRAAASGSA